MPEPRVLTIFESGESVKIPVMDYFSQPGKELGNLVWVNGDVNLDWEEKNMQFIHKTF